MIRTVLSVTAISAALGGCASSMSGVGGTDTYGCKAPEGSQCTSVSGVYANTTHAPTPSSTGASTSPDPYEATSIAPTDTTPSTDAPPSLRSAPRVLRLWIAPWEDRDGDLHEASIVHVIVDSGRWLIEHVRPDHRASLDHVVPPAATQDGPTTGTTSTPSTGAEQASAPANAATSPQRMPRAPQ